jgi:hypothetical protein
VLDLTKRVPREQQVTGVAGMSVGGIEGQPLPRGYQLPLKIDSTSIEPRSVKAGEKFTVEIRLRNVGDSAFFLPKSRNGVAVFEHEGKGRRSFAFKLIFEDPKSGRHISSFAAVSMGADTVKDSLLRIDPGKGVRVVFTGDSRPIADWLKDNLDKIDLRAAASETTFEESRYFIKSQSEEIVSETAQSIVLTSH